MDNKSSIVWVAGFFDGEGCFSIDLRKEPTSKLGFSCYPRIRIALQQSDKFVLEKIQVLLGGKISTRNPQKSWRKGAKPQSLWSIYGWKDCLRISKTIQPHLILKAERCIIFIKIIEKVLNERKISKTKKWNEKLLVEVCELRDKLNRDRSTFRHSNYLDSKALKQKLGLV